MNRRLLIDSAETLALFEDLRLLQDGARTELIATTRRGSIAARERGFAYRILEENALMAHISRHGLEVWENLLPFCSTLDRRLHEEIPEFKRRGLLPFKASALALKIMIDVVGTKAMLLNQELQRTFAGETHYVRGPLSPPHSPNLAFLDSDDVTGNLMAASPGTTFIEHSLPRQRAVTSQHLPQGLTLRNRLREVLLGSLLATDSYVVFDVGHDVYALTGPLKKHGLYLERLPVPDLKRPPLLAAKKCSTFAESLFRDGPFRSFFTADAWDLFPVIHERLQTLITHYFPLALQAYDAARDHMDSHPRRRRFALTGSITADVVTRAQMKACQDRGMKLVTYQEGGGYGTARYNVSDYIEMMDGDAFLGYGAGTVEYYQDHPTLRDGRGKKVIAIGSAHQDVVAATLKQQAKTEPPHGQRRKLMYIATSTGENDFHIPFRNHTACWYFQQQLDILDTLSTLPPSVEVLVKLHPSDKDTYTHLGNHGPYKRFTQVTGRFEACLGMADAFILDIPTTTLMIAMHTDKPIFLLGEPMASPPFPPKNLERLEKRVHYYTDRTAFLQAIKGFAEGTLDLPVKTDPEFRRAYVTANDDGRSAERAVDYLLSLSPEGQR